MKRILMLLGIALLLNSCMITEKSYKKFIIENKNNIVQKDPIIYQLDTFNLKHYDDITIEKYGDEFIIYFWSDIYSRKNTKMIRSKIELDKEDKQILKILNSERFFR